MHKTDTTTRMLLITWGIILVVFGAGIARGLVAEPAEAHEEEKASEQVKTKAEVENASEASAVALGEDDHETPVEQEKEEVPLSDSIETADLIETEPTEASTKPEPVVFEQGPCPHWDHHAAPDLDRIVDKEVPVGDYIPARLVHITPHVATKHSAEFCLEEVVAYQLYEMVQAALADDIELVVTSAFRTHTDQRVLRERSLARFGDLEYDRVAIPGHSEHQLGTAVDFTSAEVLRASAARSFGSTRAYQWLNENANDFGFYLSYPEDKIEETGYIYEPWHWRYLGIRY